MKADTKQCDAVMLYAALIFYLLNRLLFKRLDLNGMLYEIVQWHLNDFLGEIVFLCYTNILMERGGYKRIIGLLPILFVVVLTCVMWEYIMPFFIQYSTPDVKDCLAYLLGGMTYWGIQQAAPA